VFLRVFKAAKDYKPKAKFKTWLFKIAANYCLNEIRNNKNRPQGIDIFELNESGFIAVTTDSSSPEKTFESKELKVVILNAIENLPGKQRVAILLREYNDFSYQEISQVMECSISAVESLLIRARQNLKKKLLPYL
jgi:RNA polymerase sigma-70 factor (ECF subfamily)